MPSLLDMPAEIRCLIYEHLFTDFEAMYVPGCVYNLRSKQPSQRRASYATDEISRSKFQGVEILLASKLCRSEASLILEQNAYIDLDRLAFQSWKIEKRSSLFQALSSIKHLVIGKYLRNTQGFKSISKQFHSLKTFTIHMERWSIRDLWIQVIHPIFDERGEIIKSASEQCLRKVVNLTVNPPTIFSAVVAYWNSRGRDFEIEVTGLYSFYMRGNSTKFEIYSSSTVLLAEAGSSPAQTAPIVFNVTLSPEYGTLGGSMEGQITVEDLSDLV